nr:thioredoxin family protein [Candidatus Sigynarchaeota archaeon]
MKDIIRLKVFTTLTPSGYRQCPACENTASFLHDLERETNKIVVEEVSIITDKESAEHYKVTRAPTVIIQGHGIRYTGAPIGLEMAPFIFTIIMASTGKTIFTGGSLAKDLNAVQKARLELIVTPTCPYCAQAALIENSLVMESKGKLTIDIVESYENPDIAREYNVTAVPVTFVNGNPAKKIVGVPTLTALLDILS